jgi:DNA-directed RNA polymerase sigma subunit (sigma70/sigma32)
MKNQFFNGNTYTLQEIANRLGITKERVRQIEVQAIKKLRHPMMQNDWRKL